MTENAPVAATESEEELVDRARTSVSESAWTVGECAATWTQRYARGRTDADFGALIGLSGDQVFQRRRVWETFGDVRNDNPSLRWSHFYVALNWDDAPECLAWARENEATVAEMRAWRRLQHGEDLSTPAEEEPPPWEEGDGNVAFVPSEPQPVREPREHGGEGSFGEGRSRSGSAEPAASVAGVARGSEVPRDSEEEGGGERVAVVAKPDASTEQVVKRMTSSLERVNKALTKEVLDAFPDLPPKTRNRFVKAVGELSTRVARFV